MEKGKRKRVAQKGKSIEQTIEIKKKKETKKKNNEKVNEVNKQLEIIKQKFLDNPEKFYEQKEKEVAKIIEKYGDLQNEDLENGIISKKDYSLSLSYYLSKPIIGVNTIVPKYNAKSIKMANEFYWEKMVIPINQKLYYVPTIQDFLRMLGISVSTFTNYLTNGSEEMRETCQIIVDQFISYYQVRGMTREIDNSMSMFVLKTTYKQRENDIPQLVIQNNNVSSNDKIKKMAKQYGFDELNIDD